MNTISKLLMDALSQHPQKLAVHDPAAGLRVSRGQILRDASRIAAMLAENGLKPNDNVALLMPRNAQYAEALLACLLYGYGAVLLDVSYPQQRVDTILKDADVRFVLNQSAFEHAMEYAPAGSYQEPDGDTTAVVIYTSGSTGRPKGVRHSQRSAAAGVLRFQEEIPGFENDIWSCVGPFTFILGVHEMTTSLISGGSVVIVPREILLSPEKLADYLDRYHITITFCPPQLLRYFEKKGDALRIVYTGSEQVTNVAPRNYQLVNVYAMSETFSGCAFFYVNQPYDNTPIGTLASGLAGHILDENGCEASEGELCLAGEVFTGYLNLPEQTAKVLTPNPFSGQDGWPLLLHTGDLVRKLPDGNLLYLCRKDWMIKINGHRIEPGEIEMVLRSLPQIREAVVKNFTNQNGQNYLCGFYTAREAISPEEIRRQLSHRLLGYMIPAFLVELETFPLNQNGKLDRLALKAPETALFADEYAAPENALQERICNAMKQVLQIERVGVNDDFFALGGDSISVVALLSELPDLPLEVRTVYLHKTPKKIAEALDAVERCDKWEEQAAEAAAAGQKLLPYQLYYLDYQLYSPKDNISLWYYLKIDRSKVTPDALQKAAFTVFRHFAVYSTVFSFDKHGALIQKSCSSLVEPPEIIGTTETAFHESIIPSFIHPYKMMDSLLYFCKIFATEQNCYLLMEIHHAISDGSMLMQTIKAIFAVLNGEALWTDYYYLYLQKYTQQTEMPEYRKKLAFLQETYGSGGYSRHPRVDRISRKNNRLFEAVHMPESLCFYRQKAKEKGTTLGTAFLAAGLRALGKYNGTGKVAAEWIYSGRDEQWKNNLVGLTIAGIPAAVDLDRLADTGEPLTELKRQTEMGIQFAECSYAVQEVSPSQTDYMKIVYEPGIALPDNMPDYAMLQPIFSNYSGVLTLFQCIMEASAPDKPLEISLICNGAQYTADSLHRFAQCLVEALNKCLL